jgi:putative aldouronate transport system permease protein
VTNITNRRPNEALWINMKRHPMLYLMVLPGLAYFVIFKYVPLLGSVIAFQNYQIFKGLFKSPWIWLDNFKYIFKYQDFYRILGNTVKIGGLQILFGFPAPILLALMLNQVTRNITKRGLQTVLYLPHFLSWAIIGSIIFDIFSINGIVNVFRSMLNLQPVLFMQQSGAFIPIVTISFVWKEIGWSAIVYLAAISGINPQLYEAAVIEGASSWKQTIYITLPMLMPTIIVMFLLRIGNFLNLGFEQIFVLLTPTTQRVGDILDTWVYKNGVLEGKYSLTTAVGLFKSVFGLALMVACNFISKRSTGRGVY